MATTVFTTMTELRKATREARAAMLAAWHAQSKTTVEEGYTIDQANEAIRQAVEAQAYYDKCYNELEENAWRDAGPFEVATVDGVYAFPVVTDDEEIPF